MMQATVAETSSVFDRLEVALATLSAQGIVVGVEQRLRLAALLSRLAARSEMPDDPERLPGLLIPLLAASPAQQEICRIAFRNAFQPSHTVDPAPPTADSA